MAEPERLRRPAVPKTKSVLEQMVGRYARYYGIPQGRVRGWISFMVLGGALERLKDAEGVPAFVVKGGVALELRLRLRARTTKDFDATFRVEFGEMLESLDRALKEPYGDFRLMRRGEIRDVGGKAKRLEIRLEYHGRPWATVPMEVSAGESQDVEAELVPATDLSELGIDGPEYIHCLSARYQIAQKIHAATTPPRRGRENERYRDLVDLWLLRELGTKPADVREACEDVFRRRAMQPWPPAVVVPASWAEPFDRLAGEVGLPTRNVEEAAQNLREYIEEITSAR